jgi:hypothetical protein
LYLLFIFTPFAIALEKKLKVGFGNLLPESSYLKQNRPWRYRSNNGFSTAMEKHTVLRKLIYCRTTISSIKLTWNFGEEGNLIVVGVRTMLFTPKAFAVE